MPEMQKEAIAAKLLSAIRHPARRQAREALEKKVRDGLRRSVNNPIHTGLKKARIDQGIGKAVSTLTADVPGTPRLFMRARSEAERAALGAHIGKETIRSLSDNPELIPTLPLPVPGLATTILGTKKGLKKLLKVPEFTKNAAVRYDSIEDLKKKLQVGDILYTKPRSMEGMSIGNKLFYKAESAYQGSDYTHTGLYVGNGKVIDAGIWGKGGNKDTKVHLVDLGNFEKRYDFKVLRVKASPKEREEATQWAKKQIGRDFNTSGVVRMIANPFKGSPKGQRKRKTDKDASFFCSELVANAYAPHTNLAAKRKLKYVLPGDIFRSSNTKTVAEFQKEAQLLAFADELTEIATT